MSEIFVGQRLLVEMKCRLAGTPTDPTVVKFLIRTPSGTTVTLNYPHESFTKRDTGFFEANVLMDEPGTWHFRGESIGVVEGVSETFVTVSDSVFG